MTTIRMNEPAVFEISNEQIKQFEEDGVICLRSVISPHWVEHLREATDGVLAAQAEDIRDTGGSGSFRMSLDMWLRDDGFRRYALEGPSAAIAKALMRGSPVTLFADQLFVKEPGTSTPTPWHQDQTYWPVVGEQIFTVWVPMDTVTKESSGLEYIKGSHRWGRKFKPQGLGDGDLSWMAAPEEEDIPDIDAERSKYEFLSWDMEPGDALVHHSLAVHGAGGNRSQANRRRAVATRWCGEDAFFRPKAIYTPEMTGLAAGEQVSHAKSLFPPVPLPEGRKLPEDYWVGVEL